MSESKLSEKYQIVVPTNVRKALGLKAGMYVGVTPLDEYRALLTRKPLSVVDALQGLGKDMWRSLGGGTRYLKKERASWDKK